MLEWLITHNIVVLAVMTALSLIWLFLAIDVFVVKKPSKSLRAACLSLGIIGLVFGASACFVTVGLKFGFISAIGDSAEIFGLSVPGIGLLVLLFTYPAVWIPCAVFTAVSLVSLIAGAVKKSGKEKVAEKQPVGGDENMSEKENADVSESRTSPQTKPDAQNDGYRLDDVRSIMDEISGLVDSLDAEPEEPQAPTEEPQTSFSEEDLPMPEQYAEPDTDSFDEPADEQSDEPEHSVGVTETKETDTEGEEKQSDEEEPSEDEEPLTHAEKVETGKRRTSAAAAEIDDFKEVGERPQVRTLVRQVKPSDGAKDVTPQEGGLPVTKRHVLINRRNVVNMFSDYLKSKSDDEKQRLQSSINTIIIK
ncbi:MAG: hypothetical protein HFE48_06260 [Clostridia bacterium]|nr:hypothetical protein [Clostridia bacterium]